jgi:hypothetical protein
MYKAHTFFYDYVALTALCYTNIPSVVASSVQTNLKTLVNIPFCSLKTTSTSFLAAYYFNTECFMSCTADRF